MCLCFYILHAIQSKVEFATSHRGGGVELIIPSQAFLISIDLFS